MISISIATETHTSDRLILVLSQDDLIRSADFSSAPGEITTPACGLVNPGVAVLYEPDETVFKRLALLTWATDADEIVAYLKRRISPDAVAMWLQVHPPRPGKPSVREVQQALLDARDFAAATQGNGGTGVALKLQIENLLSRMGPRPRWEPTGADRKDDRAKLWESIETAEARLAALQERLEKLSRQSERTKADEAYIRDVVASLTVIRDATVARVYVRKQIWEKRQELDHATGGMQAGITILTGEEEASYHCARIAAARAELDLAAAQHDLEVLVNAPASS